MTSIFINGKETDIGFAVDTITFGELVESSGFTDPNTLVVMRYRNGGMGQTIAWEDTDSPVEVLSDDAFIIISLDRKIPIATALNCATKIDGYLLFRDKDKSWYNKSKAECLQHLYQQLADIENMTEQDFNRILNRQPSCT